MKKRGLLLLLPALLLAALCVLPGLRRYRPGSRTVPRGDSGLTFTITTFDGDAESEPFLRCMGHTWVSVDNHTGHPVFLKDTALEDGGTLTFSVWALSDHRGVVFDLEPEFIRQFGRYEGRLSLSMDITEAQLGTVGAWLDANPDWRLGKNCSWWSAGLWNELAEDGWKLDLRGPLCTPKRLRTALREFDCVETDRDFSSAGGIFFYQNGVRTELELCS